MEYCFIPSGHHRGKLENPPIFRARVFRESPRRKWGSFRRVSLGKPTPGDRFPPQMWVETIQVAGCNLAQLVMS